MRKYCIHYDLSKENGLCFQTCHNKDVVPSGHSWIRCKCENCPIIKDIFDNDNNEIIDLEEDNKGEILYPHCR